MTTCRANSVNRRYQYDFVGTVYGDNELMCDSLVRKACGPGFTAKQAQLLFDNLFFVRV